MTTMSARVRRGFCAAVATSVAAVLLGGCASEAPALPNVIVEHPGTTDLEANEFVVGVRAAELGEVLAWNTGDFTLDEVTSSVPVEHINFLYDYLQSFTWREYSPEVYAGPNIWSPVSVVVSGDTAQLEVCVAQQDRKIEKNSLETSFDLAVGELHTWAVTKNALGIFEVDALSESGKCDASAAKVLTFDPAPVLPEKITEGDIRAPQGE